MPASSRHSRPAIPAALALCLVGLVGLAGATWSLPAHAQGAPIVEHIEPTAGPPGSDVHVVGRRFGRGVRVALGGRPLPIVEALPNRVVVRIPDGAKTGPVVITNAAGVSTRGPQFRVTPPLPMPLIESFAPKSGPPGTEIIVTGKNFSPRLTGNQVTLGGRISVVRSATPTRLVVTAPAAGAGDGGSAGPIVVRVRHAGEASSGEPFTITDATAIAGLVPGRGAPGSELTIRGSGFSTTAADNRVFIHGVALPVKSASPTELVVTLPEKVASGRVLVDVRGGGRAQSASAFTVQRTPTITAVEPRRGAPGGVVELRGTHFGDDPTLIDARLGAVKLEVRALEPTRLALVVPEGARSGKLSVRVGGVGPAVWPKRFAVVPRVSIAGFVPGSGPAGHVVVIEGEGFSKVRRRNQVRIGGRRARVLKASATRLEVRVPAGPSGPVEVATAAGGSARTTRPFVITVPPRVRSVSPPSGGVGTELSIRGSGFGHNASVVRVSLGGQRLEVRSVQDDLIVARVPAGVSAGPLRVAIPLQGAAEVAWSFEPGAEPGRRGAPAK